MKNAEEDSMIERPYKFILIQCLNPTLIKSIKRFISNGRICGDTPQGFFEMTVADFASFVDAQPAASDAGEVPFLEVLSLNVHGQTAVARVRDDYISNRYLDTLSFVKTNEC